MLLFTVLGSSPCIWSPLCLVRQRGPYKETPKNWPRTAWCSSCLWDWPYLSALGTRAVGFGQFLSDPALCSPSAGGWWTVAGEAERRERRMTGKSHCKDKGPISLYRDKVWGLTFFLTLLTAPEIDRHLIHHVFAAMVVSSRFSFLFVSLKTGIKTDGAFTVEVVVRLRRLFAWRVTQTRN